MVSTFGRKAELRDRQADQNFGAYVARHRLSFITCSCWCSRPLCQEKVSQFQLHSCTGAGPDGILCWCHVMLSLAQVSPSGKQQLRKKLRGAPEHSHLDITAHYAPAEGFLSGEFMLRGEADFKGIGVSSVWLFHIACFLGLAFPQSAYGCRKWL